MCICDPLFGVTCAMHAEQSRAAAQGPAHGRRHRRLGAAGRRTRLVASRRNDLEFRSRLKRRIEDDRQILLRLATQESAHLPHRKPAPTTPEGADERNGHG